MRFHVITGILILLLAGDLALAADAFVAAVQDALVPVRETATGAADTKDKPQDGDKKSTDGKDKGKEKEKEKDKGKGKEKEKGKEKDKEKDKDKPPACMHCGATCGLEAVCVCECGTKKKPKTEYEAKCDPICVPRCSGLPWPFSHCRHGGGCTDCPSDACRAWVRQRKTLVRETTDEEVSVVERKVKYVCCRCAGCGKAGCCGGGPAGAAGWWPQWLRWLPGCGAP
jgi:hypothetical protein